MLINLCSRVNQVIFAIKTHNPPFKIVIILQDRTILQSKTTCIP